MSEYLGEFEQIVLLAIVAAWGGGLWSSHPSRIERRTDRRVSIGALYSTLDRLEAKGFVHSWFADATPQRDRRSKRYFRVLPEGTEALARSRSMLDRMWHGVELKGGFRA